MTPPRNARSTRRGAHSIESISEVAAELFFQSGYDATSMQDIADAAGLHKSSLYHHLKHKEELLEYICMKVLDMLDASLERAVGEDVAGDRAVQAFEGALALALSHPRETSIIVHMKPTTEVGRRVLHRRRSYEHRLADLIAREQSSGDVRSDVDSLLMARLNLGMINWLVEWYSSDNASHPPPKVRSAASALIAASIGKVASTKVDVIQRPPQTRRRSACPCPPKSDP